MKTKNCDIHGQFNMTEIDWIDGGKKWVGSCQKCLADKKAIDEKKKDEEKRVRYESRRLDAGISKRNMFKTFDDFQCEVGSSQESAKKKFQAFAGAMKATGKAGNLIAIGGTGSGKTLLASAMVDEVIEKRSCKLITLSGIFSTIKQSWNDPAALDEQKLIESLASYDLLIIDEVGVQSDTDWEKGIIFQIIDGRYQNMLPTVLISNLEVSEIQKIIGDRCVDRLRDEGAFVVAFDWESKRGIKTVN